MIPPLFSARHLSKRYGATTVVDDLSFDIAPGECLGVIGPNGAGKTTTIRMCLGLSVPDGGTIEALGGQMPRDALAIKAQLGVVSQMPVERLYREIRALRIYEGATEVQQLIIARELLKGRA